MRFLGTFIATPVDWKNPRPRGTVLSPNQRLAVSCERRLHHSCCELAVAYHDLDGIALRDARRQPRKRNRLAERRTERSTRDLAVSLCRPHDLVRAQDAALVDQQ